MTNAPRVSQSLAAQVRTYRKRRNLTLNQLAELCEKLGAPQLNFSALANIERGATAESKRRPREVNVDELMVLARALQVPPVLLLFGVGLTPEVEVTPGLTLDTWEATKWWNGEAYLSGDHETFWTIPLILFRAHDRQVETFAELLADNLFTPSGEEEKARRMREAEQVVMQLRETRRQIRAHGMTPPALDADMEFVDERRHAMLTPTEAEARIAAGELLRVVDYANPGAGKVMRPGDPTALQEAVERGRRFAAEHLKREGEG
ncbi:MAG: helix-turn-helix transcriptional regulator [Jiangellaceae bacterium]